MRPDQYLLQEICIFTPSVVIVDHVFSNIEKNGTPSKKEISIFFMIVFKSDVLFPFLAWVVYQE